MFVCTPVHAAGKTKLAPELFVELRSTACKVQDGQAMRLSLSRQAQTLLCSVLVHHLLSQGGALNVAVTAGLIAIQPNVELHNLGDSTL